MRSMTGFGRGTAANDEWSLTVEISAVNRKQAEVVVLLPRELNELEASIRQDVAAGFSRGRLQVSLSFSRNQRTDHALQVDQSLALSLEQAFADISKLTSRQVLPSAADFLRYPGIINQGNSAPAADDASSLISPALADAMLSLNSMRDAEGEHLAADLHKRIALLEELRNEIHEASQSRLPRQREAMLKRLHEAGLPIDLSDERLLKELALFSDRCDISEELTRLDSHFAKCREFLLSPESVGRSLDFLCQELFREFNTIGSKANDASLAHLVVAAKTEVERIREQVQNVE